MNLVILFSWNTLNTLPFNLNKVTHPKPIQGKIKILLIESILLALFLFSVAKLCAHRVENPELFPGAKEKLATPSSGNGKGG